MHRKSQRGFGCSYFFIAYYGVSSLLFLIIMETPKKQTTTCGNRLCNEKAFKRCTRCKIALYCSKECQVQHWRRHKKCCKMFSSSPGMRRRYLKAVEDCASIAANQSLTFECDRGNLKQRKSGEYDQALLTLHESLELFQEFQYDSGISDCYYSIGRALNSNKQYEEALVNYRKALEINREIHGENHNHTCCCYDAIGIVLTEQGRYDDALIGFGKALAIRMKFFGENHIDTARSYYHIGLNQLQKGDYDGALLSLQKAKKIYTRELGEEHELTVDTNHLINFCKQRIDRGVEAVVIL